MDIKDRLFMLILIFKNNSHELQNVDNMLRPIIYILRTILFEEITDNNIIDMLHEIVSYLNIKEHYTLIETEFISTIIPLPPKLFRTC